MNVGLNLPKLLKNTAEFTSIDLNGLTANLVKRADSTFNFDYIINTFTTEEENNDSRPFVINLDKIRLQNLKVTYKDLNSKNNIALKLGDLKTVVQNFDLETNTYKLDYIDADGFKLNLNQGLLGEATGNIEKKVDSLSQENPLQVGVNKVNLTNFDVLYDDENTATETKIIFKELNASINKLDVPNADFEITKLSTKDLFADVLLIPNSDENLEEVSKKESDAIELNPLKVLLKEADLQNVNVVYNNGLSENNLKSFNPNHINLANLNGKLSAIRLNGTDVSGELKDVRFIENSGFVLEQLSTKFGYSLKETYLKDLYLKTPNTELQRSLKLNYNTIDDFTNNLGNVVLELKLPKSKIGFKDILWLAPDLKNTAPFNKYPNAVLNVSAEVKGKVNDLLIQQFKVSGLENLKVNASGSIKNALDVKNLSFNLKVDEFKANKKLVENIVPKNTIPNSIELPEQFSVKGKLRGRLDDLYTDLVLASSFGNAQIKGTFNQQRKNSEHYDLTASLGQFDVGRLLKQKDIGTVTASTKIKGTGFDFTKNNVSIDALVNEATYNKYTYQNISLKGGLNQGNYNVDLNSNDENAKILVTASGIYDENKPMIKTEGTIFKVDLNKLGFSETPMTVAGKLNADFSSINPDELNGRLFLKDFSLSNGEEIYPISEIKLVAVSNETINSIDLKSQILDVSLTGKYKLTQISSSLLHTLNQYYQFQKEDQTLKIEPNQQFNFRAKIKNDDLIRKFVPDLTSFATINLYGAYNVDDEKITVYGSIPQLQYGVYQLNDIKLSAGNEEQQLNYSITLNELESEQFLLENIVLDGVIANDLIDYNLLVKNNKEQVQYKIAGNVATDNDVLTMKLKPNGLVLNYGEWTVAEDNSLVVSPQGILAQNVLLENKESLILVNSENDSIESPLNVEFKNFEIATLTEIIRKDELLAEGTINGKAQLKDLTKDLRLTTDLNIKNLKVFGNEIGTIDAQVANETASLYNANVKLSGFDNKLSLVGSYDLEQSQFNADVDIQALQMISIQGFSLGQLRDSKGSVSGKIKATGTTDQPNILGELKFNDAAFGVTQLNTTFQNINDKILFTPKGIEFDTFKINDTDGNSLTINGAVLTKTYRDFKFNLSANTRNFKVVNSTKSDNQMLFGTMAVNANLTIKGDLNLPKVDGQITVTDQTDFTFVMPQSSPALQEREGIIEFVNQEQWHLDET
ncbi:MAG TPA: translocation/assembly module TamB domain-containing protein, partial [Flavobacterium sp.]|nr:translocation/assembly module TamB domain-containing protein [Flavobacterium sp.]